MAFVVSAIAGVTGIAAGTLVAGAAVGVSAYGAYKGSQAQKANANFSKEQAQRNAEIAARNAYDIQERGKDAIVDQKKATLRALGNIRASAAGAGLVVDQADTTPQDLVVAMTEAGELDVVRLQENINREEQRALDQGAGFTAQAGQFAAQARSINPFFSAASSGLNAAAGSGDILFGS